MNNILKDISLPVIFAIILIFAFLLSFLPNSFLFIILKIILVVGAIFGAYYFLGPGEADSSEENETEAESDTEKMPESEIEQEWIKLEDDRDIEEIFRVFLETAMPLIKQTIVAETVSFLLVNYSKKKFYIRHKITDHEESFIKERFIDLNQGLPYIIFKNKNSVIENHLPEGDRLIPYYKTGQCPARSFIGTPIYFDHYAIGVLCADSGVEECFSNEDLQILKYFSKLLSIQLAGSNKLYEYETENWMVKVLYDFSKQVFQMNDVSLFWNFVGKYLKENLHADRLFVAEKLDDKTGKIIYLQGDTRSLKLEQSFPLNEGIVGWVLRKNQSLLVDDFASKENYIPRFFLKEQPAREFRSLLTVPISNQGNVRGVICIESFKSNAFKEQYKKILETMAYQMVSFLEKTEMMEKLKSQTVIHSESGLGNEKAFVMELSKEIERSVENNQKFSLLVMEYDHQLKQPDSGIEQQLESEFLSFMLPHFGKKNYIFRLSDKVFGLIFINQLLRDVLPVVQKIFEQVEEKRIWADGRVQSFSLFGGVSQFPEMGTSPEILVEKTKLALVRAREKGPFMLAIADKTEINN